MVILVFLISYLLGSISPAYFLGKLLRGIDIRKYGSGNAGTINVFKVLGTGPGILTLVFDCSKGILALALAYAFGLSFPLVCVAGFCSILGHIFPFYLKFQGGKGGATTYGLIVVLLIKAILEGLSWMFPVSLIIFALSLIIITGSGNLAAFICFPIFILILPWLKWDATSIALIIFSLFSLGISVINVLQGRGLKKEIKFREGRKPILIWRKVIRFLSLVIPLSYFYWGKITTICFTLILSAIFFVLSLPPFRQKLGFLFKKQEKISGYLLFLLAALITIIFFPKEVAILALVCASLGDNFAGILGELFGRKQLVDQKSLEGSVACFTSCFLAGIILNSLLDLPVAALFVASGVATLTELFSGNYDNLIIAPLVALSLSIIF